MRNPTTNCKCGTFTDPEVPDEGGSQQPFRQTCEAPEIPLPDCDNTDFTVIPDEDGQGFKIEAAALDEDCEEILDENDEPILTLIA